MAAAYAIGVRGYHELGGTVGLPGVLEDPAAVRRASLAAGAALLLAGLACLALVRPWGLRLPRRPVVVTALAGAVIAVTHALIAYVSKPLHLLGAIHLEFKGWIEIDETEAILWDLLFYEPWFLGLGVLVTIAAGHHHRRAGGGEREWRRLVIAAAGVTAVWPRSRACSSARAEPYTPIATTIRVASGRRAGAGAVLLSPLDARARARAGVWVGRRPRRVPQPPKTRPVKVRMWERVGLRRRGRCRVPLRDRLRDSQLLVRHGGACRPRRAQPGNGAVLRCCPV